MRVANAIAAGALGATQIATIAAQGAGGGASASRFTSGLCGGGSTGGESSFGAATSANINAPQFANDNGGVTVNITNNTPAVVSQGIGPNGEIEIMIEEAASRAANMVADQIGTGIGPVADQLARQTNGRAVSV